eukprot:SAG25_NODE_514_length_7279_cov_5.792758_11_plen_52_part_00
MCRTVPSALRGGPLAEALVLLVCYAAVLAPCALLAHAQPAYGLGVLVSGAA